MNTQSLDELRRTRYALLHTVRRDGTPVDTPVWFGVDGNALVFGTKMGPKTKRLAARPDVELTACDHKGRAALGAATLRGRTTILSDVEAERANRVLRKRW
jgi:PPOX class probable F420-dependent enzyme